MRLGAADFAGRWAIAREIEDRRSGGTGVLEGEAVFTPTDYGLFYEESGLLRMGGGAALRAERRYRWVFGEGRVEVFFDTGLPFHDFAPEGVSAGTEHLCGADLYRVRYDFSGWPGWAAVWTVAGPAKDYTMRTAYSRA